MYVLFSVPPGPALVPVMSGRVFSSVGAEFTLSWDPPSNAAMVVGGVGYSVGGGACGLPVAVSGTSATFAKPPDNRVCSIQVTATNGRCNFTSDPLVIDITFEGQHSSCVVSVVCEMRWLYYNDTVSVCTQKYPDYNVL